MSYAWGAYASPTSCTPRTPLGATSLAAYLKDSLSYTFSMGICNCRNVGGSSSLSHHANCRAYDCGIPTNGGKYRPELGDPIHQLLGPAGRRLGLDHLILNRIIYSARSPNGREYKGVHPHYNHAHIGLTAAAGLNLNYASIVAILGPPAGVPIGGDGDMKYENIYKGWDADDILVMKAKGLWDGVPSWYIDDIGTYAHVKDWENLVDAVLAGDAALPPTPGPKGDKGDIGPKGADGTDGPKGDQGIRGAKGDTGLKGADGEDGADGKPASLTISGDQTIP